MASDNDQIINTEIATLKEKVPQLPGLELVTCVRALVRIQIRLTEYKQLSVCMQFPENYPQAPLLVELKSKTLGDKLLDRLTKICDDEARKQVGQKQVLILVKFLKQFLEDNPLCSCSEEISHIKRNMLEDGDDLKVKQKTSQILLKLQKNKYFMNLRISVPENYPKESVQVEVSDSNFPKLLRIFFRAQAQEIGRQCVQPPLKKQPNGATFTPQPSLRKVCEFVIMESIKRYPDETCPLCKHKCLPVEPEAALSDRSQHVIRVYCGHIFHFGCMDDYMKTPPFTGGKKCPSCDKRIYHDQWKQSPELAEARWAHKQARARELDEVMDFLQ